MKCTLAKIFIQRPSPDAPQKNAKGRLALAVVLLFGLTIPSAAQTTTNNVAREQGFTVPVNTSTPIVLKTSPDAACDLHAEGVTDKARTLRFYANIDGYLKIHATVREASEEGSRMQLDCLENGAITRYPIHLRSSDAPTPDMPAPVSVMPTPKGSKVLPGLSGWEVSHLSDAELIDRGYEMRPDAAAAPDKYAEWLDLVSRPMTIVPPHVVSRSDIRHQQNGVHITNKNWSGYVAQQPGRSYKAVEGCWNVPRVDAEPNNSTYSSFWIGLDGYELTDLGQAGTEQDAIDDGGSYYANYSAWEELLPNQPTAQDVSLSPNDADKMCVEVWISTGSGAPDSHGQYAAFRLEDVTQNQTTGSIYVPLAGTEFNGEDAEWIMERPCLDWTGESCKQYAQLSDYIYARMRGAAALTIGGTWENYSAIENVQLTMFNEYLEGDDNNLLSEGYANPEAPSTDIEYTWMNWH